MTTALLLSGYDARSHRHWLNTLVRQIPEVEWTVVALPDRHFAWRMGGNAFLFADHPELKKTHDVVVATSMTDLATLMAWFPEWHSAKKILYFHENQMVYPASQSAPDQLHFQINSIKSAVAADQLLFNSQYNQDSFLAGVSSLVNRMPDGLSAKLPQDLKQKSKVIPVPLADDLKPQGVADAKPWQVVWNHRWEHDKGPELLFQVMQLCQNLPLTFAVIGQQFRQQPAIFDQIKNQFDQQISHWGFVEKRTDYLAILDQSQVVLSTAHHEFQGLAVAEAVAMGCTPLVPNRLVYPELYPASCCYQTNGQGNEAELLVKMLHHWLDAGRPEACVDQLQWQNLKSEYLSVFKLLQ